MMDKKDDGCLTRAAFFNGKPGSLRLVFDQIKRSSPEKVSLYLSVWKKNYTFTDCFISGNIMIYQ